MISDFAVLASFYFLPFQAFAYGELRLVSKSVWPAWLLHTFANAISRALLSNGFVGFGPNFSGVLLSPGTEGWSIHCWWGVSDKGYTNSA
jgi:hypothetical protein